MLVAWASCCLLLAFAYGGSVLFFRRRWRALPEWRIPDAYHPHLPVSVLIPARNEAANVGPCLESILDQNYPPHLLEIIVIDDHSTDGTLPLVRALGGEKVRTLSLPAGTTGKKAALTAGVAAAGGELIVTTDADCFVSPDWLLLLTSFYKAQRPSLIAGPVELEGGESALQRFQSLDFTGMMLLTGAGLSSGLLLLANGANLAFPRAAFEAVGGYRGVEHYASGDDVFLLRKMLSANLPAFSPPAFLKARKAVVRTGVKRNWRSFLNQRLRWATKNRPLDKGLTSGAALQKASRVTLLTLAITFFLCWSIIINLLLAPLMGWTLFWLFVVTAAMKALVDYGLLSEATRFFRRQKLLKWFWPSQALHILYIALVGLLGNIAGRYQWKGRRVR